MGGHTIGFDLDMTLIDSRPSLLAAFAGLAGELGIAIDLDVVDARLGVKLEEELGHWMAPGDIPAAAAAFRRRYVVLASRSTPTMPGAAAALAAVRAAGGTSVIVTAKHEVSAGPALAAAGLQADRVFTFVHGPEKAAVLRQVSAAAYVGDTPADMEAATGAAAAALGVATGSYGAPALRAAGAGTVLSSMEEFPSWYAGFRRIRGI